MKNKIENVTIGADIEFFYQNPTTGEFVSAEGIAKGSKRRPFNFNKEHRYFITSLDNVAIEMGIPPATTVDEWEEYLMKGVQYINRIAPEGLVTVPVPTAIFLDKYLQTDNAKEFGCEPDYCSWTREVNERPHAQDQNLRSAGGHIHVGYEQSNDEEERVITNENIVKAMDIFLGVPSVILEPDNKRKELYGKAGAFRFKEYGIEYRTISNFYMANDRLRRWAFENTLCAVDFVNKTDDVDLVAVEDALAIQEAINTSNKDLAKNLIDKFNIPLC